ncbi:g7364 [Coccomyxa elongata]
MTESSYIGKIQDSLFHSITLVDLPCQHVDGYSKPEIELQNSKELLLDPIEIRKNEQECTLIERSVNSVRISVQLKLVDDLEGWLRSKRIAFILERADHIDILRREPVPGFDMSFLVTARHLQMYNKAALIRFIVSLMTELASANDLKRLISSRGRVSSLSISKALVI